MSFSMSYLAAALLACVLLEPASAAMGTQGIFTPAAFERAPLGEDYSYQFRIAEGSHGSPTVGTVRVHGDRTRIDVQGRGHDREYILLLDRGQRMLVVHPEKREIQQMATSDFAAIVGTAIRAVSPVVKVKLLHSEISAKSLGPGAPWEGYRTEHVRLTERYDARLRALGFDSGVEHHSVTTDYWIAPDLALRENPLARVLTTATTALAQTDPDFVRRDDAMRADILRGALLRAIVSVAESENDQPLPSPHIVMTLEVTDIRTGAQPANVFDIPAGYTTTTSYIPLDW